MFSYFNSYATKTPSKILTINQFVDELKNHTNRIRVEEIRQQEYKSKTYDQLKSKSPCIKVHGIFSSQRDNSIQQLNNYLYFDIDNAQLNKTQLLTKYPFISLAAKSIGGHGYFFLVKVDKLTIENFKSIWQYFYNEVFQDINIDTRAVSLSRNLFISYDEDVYYNNDATYTISDEDYANIMINYGKTVKKSITIDVCCASNNLNQIEQAEKYHYTPNDTIPYNELINQIILKSNYDKPIDGLYTIEKQEMHFIFIPKTIKDGDKHRVFTRITHGLIYLNREISFIQILSYLHYINNNNTGNRKMNFNRMTCLVRWLYDNYKKSGQINVITRSKKIHFDANSDLSTKEKQILGAKINAVLRKNETIQIIRDAKAELKLNKQIVSQSQVLIHLNSKGHKISIATIKRNWNGELKDINQIEFSPSEYQYFFEEINENNLWN